MSNKLVKEDHNEAIEYNKNYNEDHFMNILLASLYFFHGSLCFSFVITWVMPISGVLLKIFYFSFIFF